MIKKSGLKIPVIIRILEDEQKKMQEEKTSLEKIVELLNGNNLRSFDVGILLGITQACASNLIRRHCELFYIQDWKKINGKIVAIYGLRKNGETDKEKPPSNKKQALMKKNNTRLEEKCIAERKFVAMSSLIEKRDDLFDELKSKKASGILSAKEKITLSRIEKEITDYEGIVKKNVKIIPSSEFFAVKNNCPLSAAFFGSP